MIVLIPQVVIYLLTWPANRTDADDGFDYAYLVSRGSLDQMIYQRTPYYLPLSKFIYSFFEQIDPYTFLCIQSLIFSVAAVVSILIFCRHFMNFSKEISVMVSVTLILSYGFWRYSTEAEVYTMTIFLSMITIISILSRKIYNIISSAAFAAISVSIYRPSAIIVFVAPIAFFMKSKNKGFYYYGMGGSLAIVAYVVAFNLGFGSSTGTNFYDFILFLEAEGAWRFRPVAAVMSFGTNFISANWIFGFGDVVNIIKSVFPLNDISEEIYAANHVGLAKFASLLTFSCTLFLFCALMLKSVRFVSFHFFSVRVVILSWFIAYFLMCLLLSPSAPEAWVPIAAPTSLVLGALVYEPAVRAGRTRLCMAFILFLGLHNWVGGLWVLHSAEGDLYRVKARWLGENLRPGDTVITCGDPGFARYVRYRSVASVLDPFEQDGGLPMSLASLDRAVSDTRAAGGRVFTNDGCVRIPQRVMQRYAVSESAQAGIAARLKCRVLTHWDADGGAIVEVLPCQPQRQGR